MAIVYKSIYDSAGMVTGGISGIQRIVSYGEANGLGCVTGIYP